MTGRHASLAMILASACATARAPVAPAHVAVPAASSDAAATLRAAADAFARYDLATSRRLYDAVLANDKATPDERITATLALSFDDWTFDHDASAARRRLDAALATAPRTSRLLTARANIAVESDAAAPALADSERALSANPQPAERAAATLSYARAALALHSSGAAIEPPGPPHLRTAAQQLVALLDRQPGHPEASALLLSVAVALADGPLALEAWRSYFFVANDGSVPSTLAPCYAVLRDLLSHWRDRPLTQAERSRLALALAESRFYALAAELAAALTSRDRAISELLAYHDFIKGVAAVNSDFYPRVAKGLSHYQEAYDDAIRAHARRLWTVLAPNKPFDDDAFFTLIRDRFAAEGYLGTTVNYYGMLMGHVVQDERRRVEQYGYASEFRFVLIDRMISRDFTSWYGTTNVGGWGTESTMFQVRAAYIDEPFRRLAWVTDPAARAKLEAELTTLAHEDEARCAADPYSQPASLAPRIKLRASDALWAELGRKGLVGRARALAFVAESLRLNVEATVFAHEGRHALDQRYFKEAFAAMPDDERELRAKLSEVAFSSNPMLALTGSIIGGKLDETSGHGKANRRFRVLLVDWMKRHAGEIAGLDLTRPLMLQVDRLTPAQLVSIVRAADPLAATR